MTRTLLESVLPGPLDARVRDLIIAETNGNPLALLELPRGLTPAELAGGFGLPGAPPLSGRIEDSFRRQLAVFPAQTRQLIHLAAADPSGDRALVWRAAGRLGIPPQAAAPAVEAGLVEFGPLVRFRHPLVRSAAYRSASFTERQLVHQALAAATDPRANPTAGPGTGRTPRRGRMRRSPRSWKTRPGGRRHAADWPRRRRSSNARPC